MPTSRELLTVPEAADRYRLHPKTLYRWIRKGVIGCVRVGPYQRIRLRDAELVETVTAEDQREA